MKQLSPHREFIPAPTAGCGENCQSFANIHDVNR